MIHRGIFEWDHSLPTCLFLSISDRESDRGEDETSGLDLMNGTMTINSRAAMAEVMGMWNSPLSINPKKSVIVARPGVASVRTQRIRSLDRSTHLIFRAPVDPVSTPLEDLLNHQEIFLGPFRLPSRFRCNISSSRSLLLRRLSFLLLLLQQLLFLLSKLPLEFPFNRFRLLLQLSSLRQSPLHLGRRSLPFLFPRLLPLHRDSRLLRFLLLFHQLRSVGNRFRPLRSIRLSISASRLRFPRRFERL